MTIRTAGTASPSNYSPIGYKFDFQSKPSTPKPVELQQSSTVFLDGISLKTGVSQRPKTAFLPPSPATVAHSPMDADTAVIQLWEGCVLSLDLQNEVMNVLLSAKIGQVPEHTAEISLQWVADQDRDLVQPGAVFYLTLFKQLRRGSVQNSQELRFRRRPAWSRQQIERIQVDAAMIRSKLKARPIAE